ncbi:P-II family nitrogen regulator [Pontibacillus yanchengensis]|uniref:P-II family nitrogen regulator n=2 Tax=Pontibacillus yanchengensis TaxID=462910 RepID=A0ACC7VHY3_9BACI|nr:P-II family nitrogen regulator [Pontibacillus yanchengensis]MYL35981.1 P-II family nitrogen regulator [Pontibacillus yanchengensis]MYL54377.1 P-II family nitrogen regulator [Pontibacillus yanchengensis]
MKKVESVIRPESFPALREKLDEVEVNGLTVSEVAGYGKQKGLEGVFRGTRYEIKLYPKVKVEMIVDEEQVDQIINLIKETCITGETGDGKIFIYPVENVIRIRTGEEGKEAII